MKDNAQHPGHAPGGTPSGGCNSRHPGSPVTQAQALILSLPSCALGQVTYRIFRHIKRLGI